MERCQSHPLVVSASWPDTDPAWAPLSGAVSNPARAAPAATRSDLTIVEFMRTSLQILETGDPSPDERRTSGG